MNDFVYLDHAATTAVREEVINEMIPYFDKNYGNPSSIYAFSQNAKDAINNARSIIENSLNAKDNTIYFTSGGTESDNWAIKMIAKSYKNKGKHIITSKIEHHAILHSAKYLEANGYEITYLDVDENGVIKLNDLRRAIRKDTILISVMFANNEIGTIEPIKEIGRIARENGIIFHTDAVQAYGQIPIDVEEFFIDMLSASSHKLNGPKGVGFLYIRDNIKIDCFMDGGGQEYGLRAGTENVPGIVGFGKAAEIAFDTMEYRIKNELYLRNYMIHRIINEIPFTRLNGSYYHRLPNNINFSFQFIEGEALLVMLDLAGICCSSGSACNSSSKNISHVLQAIGIHENVAKGSIRFTLGFENTKEEIDYVINNLKDCINKLRESSPEYEDYKKSYIRK